jgi:hypothetical protein
MNKTITTLELPQLLLDFGVYYHLVIDKAVKKVGIYRYIHIHTNVYTYNS